MSYNTRFFANLGKGIAQWYELQQSKENIETILEEWVSLLNDTIGERVLLADAATLTQDTKEDIEGLRDAVVDIVENYINGEMKNDLFIDVSGKDTQDVLDRLDDAMFTAGDTVLESYGLVSTPTADEENAGGSVCSITDQTQQLHDEIDYSIECFNDDTPGAELWYVRNTDDDLRGQATTGIEYEDELYGVSFMISGIAVVDDRHYFHTEISGIGLIQYYCVENHDVALQNAASGLNTISDDLARWSGADY